MKAHLLLAGAALACTAFTPVAEAKPEFVPSPGTVYRNYTALEMPRADVPVGALWVQDFGPAGDGAAPANLVTERSLSQVVINSDLQLSLTAGILNLFGLDPSYRTHLSARFGDITIVRVKDMAGLDGPDGEPRIYEALKAGTITISTDKDFGLDLDTRASALRLPVTARASNGRRRSFSIDGKDMFIAFRVATLKPTHRDIEDIRLKRVAAGWSGSFKGRGFVVEVGRSSECGTAAVLARAAENPSQDVPAAAAAAEPAHPVSSLLAPPATAGAAGAIPTASAIVAPPTSSTSPPLTPEMTGTHLPLRVPMADGRGGVFDRAIVDVRSASRREAKSQFDWCSRTKRAVDARVTLLGMRLEEFNEPRAPRW